MIGVIIAIGFLGFIIHIAAKFDPLMSALWIDTIGALIMWLVPMFLVIYRLKTELLSGFPSTFPYYFIEINILSINYSVMEIYV